MAVFIPQLIFLTTFLQGLAAQRTNSSVSVGATLTATPNATPWLSPSGEFAFGFQQVQGNDNFLLSIWYDKIPDKTIVWYPRNGTVSQGSKVELTNGRGLVLSDPQGRQVWSSGSISDLAYGAMNDTGNFMLVGSDSRKKWESFNFPADTLLPTQIMPRNGVINSRMSDTNFTGGRFQLRLLQDGNLVLNPVLFFDSADDSYYSSNTEGDSNSTNSGDKLILDATGYMYILKRNGERSNLTVRETIPWGDYYFRATLDSDGVFTQYYYPKNPNGDTSWEVMWFEPKDICREGDSRACGLNSVCSLNSNGRPTCECPKGFSLFDSSDPHGDCKPDFSPSCDEVYSEDQFDFIELRDIDWLYFNYAFIDRSTEEDCKTSCLKDCFCAIAIYRVNQCWKKRLPLSNGKVDSSGVKAFVKFPKYRKHDRPLGAPPHFSGEMNDRQSLIKPGSALFGTSVFVNIVLSVVICFGVFLIYKKKIRKLDLGGTSIETNVIRFRYNELVQATNRFKDELGKGAFGIVYKGVIGTKTVAVKKLDRMFQDGEKEFRTEVNAIARIHHKNLVQLHGFCDDGEQRLLVYEYMSNGTLASFLFGNMRPSWSHRCSIAFGIAKGLSYLHEECSTQIIHCDIKPQNILLDEYYNARISDFGLAKLLSMNQSRTNTGIRGTKGYVSPEWFRNTPVSAKVDVYSFGVLLLEIISCRKSVKENESGNDYAAILTDWAWDCFQERRLDVLVENDLEALEDVKNLKTFVMVGLWCIQENPSLRPTMRMVIQMLEGVVEVNEPPCPFPFSISER